MSRDDSQNSELSEDSADSAEDQLLRALAAAPRPSGDALARVLPELADTLESEPGDAPAPGTVIEGRYRLERVLGRGGMGVVFEAVQLATGRKVALKWMRSRDRFGVNPAEDGPFLRFVREAQVAGRIRHPNVVDVYDAGVSPSAPYLVMEKLEGETLRARIERGPMGWDEALALILPAMDGISAAHEKGVIHRDIKPDNIFLTRDAAGNTLPKVLDFGISRLHGGDSVEASLTRTGATVGTPAYMPLEQLCGTGSDERTDVYALGVVLYEMLVGERPYTARNAADFAVVIASKAAVPLSRHRPELAFAEAVVGRALERDSANRYESVRAFADALRGVGLAKPKRPLWPWLSLAAALVLGSLAFAFWPQEPAPRPAALVPEQAAPAVVTAPANPTPEPAPPAAVPEVVPEPKPAREPVAKRAKTRARADAPAEKPAARGSLGLEEVDFRPAAVPASPAAPNQKRPPALDLGRDDF